MIYLLLLLALPAWGQDTLSATDYGPTYWDNEEILRWNAMDSVLTIRKPEAVREIRTMKLPFPNIYRLDGTPLITFDDEGNASIGTYDEFTTTEPAYEWETVKVDSANLGCWPLPPKPIASRSRVDSMCVGTSYPLYHNWVYSELYPSAIAYAPLERERICRHCKRREWQIRVEVPPRKSEFEQLKETLR